VPTDHALTATVRLPLEVDLRLTLGPLRHGPADPTLRPDPGGAWWRATRTAAGPATLRLAPAPGGVTVQAWGPGAQAALDAAPALLGAGDSLEGFRPTGIVRDLHRRMPGLRIPRSGAVFEQLAPTILEQKVASVQAHASWRSIVRAWGAPAPGPAGLLLLPPPPAALRDQPAWAYHRMGVEQRRANRVRMAATYGRKVEQVAGLPAEQARRRLEVVPGVGPWTAATVAGAALGDADAVPVGDLHLPHLASWALAGEPRGSDERMLELLAVYAGHRGRVLRLLAAGGLWAPRRGPRMPLRHLARH